MVSPSQFIAQKKTEIRHLPNDNDIKWGRSSALIRSLIRLYECKTAAPRPVNMNLPDEVTLHPDDYHFEIEVDYDLVVHLNTIINYDSTSPSFSFCYAGPQLRVITLSFAPGRGAKICDQHGHEAVPDQALQNEIQGFINSFDHFMSWARGATIAITSSRDPLPEERIARYKRIIKFFCFSGPMATNFKELIATDPLNQEERLAALYDNARPDVTNMGFDHQVHLTNFAASFFEMKNLLQNIEMSRPIEIYIERTRNLDQRMPRNANFNLEDHYFEMNNITREYIVNSDAEQLQRHEEFRQYVDNRFDGIDKRFDGIDKRFDSIDNRFDRMERALGALLRVQGLDPNDFFENQQ